MIRPTQPRSAPRHVRGIGLIEVLVSVLVLAVGLLGIAAMQSMALRGGQGSLESSQAVMQSSAIIEAIRANKANAGNYNMASMACAAPGAGTLAQNDLRQWVLDLKSTIGAGALDTTTCGQVTGCPNACVITVRWDDTRAGGATTRTVVTGTRI
ncbi:MAG: type IV pilus modification protein PilV [Lysobacteraceae bacterium]|nr:MAG: type IV pilus modification protein PilV [Xanthomonadaceae bacterium]